MEQEIWKPVIGYESLYAVSSFGRVKRTTLYNNSTNKPLRPLWGDHYDHVCLSKNGKQRSRTIHRLVAEAFIGIPNGLVVNHIDGNKLNNRLSNLEVISRSENEIHKRDVLKRGNLKLDWGRVTQIRELRSNGQTLKSLAIQFGVTKANVSAIVKFRSWKPL